MPWNLINPQSPLFGGPYGIQAYLLPPGLAAAPFEGPWIPITGAKNASLEVAGTIGGGTLSLQLVGTNDPAVAAINNYTITIGGTITNGDTVTATFTNPGLPTAGESVTVPVVTADTTTTIAAKMAAAINADAALNALGITATSAVAVVTVTFPSIAPGTGSAGAPPTANFTGIVGSKSGGATETITIANGSNGSITGMPAAITSVNGMSNIPAPLPLFVKARMTLTGATNPSLTAALNASI